MPATSRRRVHLTVNGRKVSGEVEPRRHLGDFALVGVGCLLSLDRNDTINRAAIVLIGVDTAPVRLHGVERAFIGRPANAETFKEAVAKARAIEALSDAQVSASYRQRLAGVLVERALNIAAKRARGGADARH